MTTSQRKPAVRPWTVVSVFDPDGRGADLAYTVGLHELGLPELQMWARPSAGDDPGADWMFNPRERASILNDLAARLVDGTLAAGDRWADEFDLGLTRCEFTVGDPQPPAVLDAHQANPDATVLPVRYTLHRPAPRPLSDVSAATAGEIRAAVAAETAALDHDVDGFDPDLAQHLPGTPADVSCTQRYGPWTPLVEVLHTWVARYATWLQVRELVYLAASTARTGRLTPRVVLGAAGAYARASGRADAFDAAATLASADTGILLSEYRDDLLDEFTDAAGRGDDDTLLAGIADALGHLLAAGYTATVVADLLPAAVHRAGSGPLRLALHRGFPTDLCADPATVAAARAQNANLTTAELTGLAARWWAQLDECSRHLATLTAHATEHARGVPPLADLLDATVTEAALPGLPDRDTRDAASTALDALTLAVCDPDGPGAAELRQILTTG